MFDRIKRWDASLQKAQVRLLKMPAVLLLSRIITAAGEHDVSQRAAGVAYYALLSLFPLLLALIAAFGYILPSFKLQDELLLLVGKNLPGATDIVRKNIVSIVDLRGAVGVLSIVGLFWGATAIFGAVSTAIRRAWEIRKGRPFYIQKAGELGMVLSTGILFLLSLGASTILAILRGIFHVPVADQILIEVGSRLVAFLLLLAVFLILYKLIPNTKTHWRYVWPGALLAAILFEGARMLFIYYLEHFANYQLVYGSIASIIVLLIWIYYSAYIMILGAEFSSQYSRMSSPVTT
jgi:membrane protein